MGTAIAGAEQSVPWRGNWPIVLAVTMLAILAIHLLTHS